MPYRSANRAVIRGQIHEEVGKQMRSLQRMQALVDTSTIHYNPTGPGDYNLPSSFGNLPPPRQKKKLSPLAGDGSGEKVFFHSKPSFSMGQKINDNRVFKNNLHTLHSVEAPPLGSYEPVNPKHSGFEDKARLNLIRSVRQPWNPRGSRVTMQTDGSQHRFSQGKLSEPNFDPTASIDSGKKNEIALT